MNAREEREMISVPGSRAQRGAALNTTLHTVKTLLVLVAILVGVVVAVTAGFLAVVNGSTVAAALATGGGAFAVSVTLALLIENALTN